VSRELRGVSLTGRTLYVRIVNAAGLYWNGTRFEAYNASNYSAYVVALTEQGTSGFYVADFPTAIDVSGTYEYFVHYAPSGSAAEGDLVVADGKVDWTGTSSAVVPTGEITGVSPTGTLYARLMNPSGLWWNGTTFEAYSSANYADYVLSMSEQGDSGVYSASFPSTIQTPGEYEYVVHLMAGASPAEGDTPINTGKVTLTAEMTDSSASGSMSGSDFYTYVLRKFKRTDKETEVYEAITDAVQALRVRFMFDEAEAEQETTDTIGYIGDYKLDLETDFGLLLGIRVEDGNTGIPLVPLNKAQFNAKYPGIDTDPSAPGFPINYCIYGGKILIGPAPDKTSYVFRIAYSRRAGTVTSSTSGVPFTAVYRDMLRDLVLSYLWDGLEEDDKAAKYKAKFEESFLFATRREVVNSGNSTFNVQTMDV
jgi:hypothetical protein